MESQPDVWPGPPGRQPGAHWWSIQPPPPVSPISVRRAYAEVILLVAAFFAAGIVAGGETLAGHYSPPSGSWATFTPAAISELATAGLAVLAVVLLSARRGITPRSLGLCWPSKADGRPGAARSLRIGVVAAMALLAGGLVTAALAMGNTLGQPAHQDASYLIYTLAASLTAGVVEETVVLAFVVTTLRQAGRPLPEIVAVAVLLRCSYHDYYGLGMVGIAVWATFFIWLFLRTGSVLPLVVVHFLWDASIFLGQRWPAVPVVGANVFVLLVIAAGITWAANLASRRSHQQAPLGGMPGAASGGWPEPPGSGPPAQGPPAQGPPVPGPPVQGPPVPGPPPSR